MSKLSITIILITVLGCINTTPAKATSFKNIPFEQKEQFKELDNKNSDLSNKELLKIPLNLSDSFSKNHDIKNELEYRVFHETQNIINKLKEANKVTQETISGKTVYFYKLENPAGTFRNNTNIPETNQIRWKLSAPEPKRKIPEPATSVALVAFSFLAMVRSLNKVQKF